MQTDFPKEYVTLRSGQTDNYSEVYGNRYVQRLQLRFQPDDMVYNVSIAALNKETKPSLLSPSVLCPIAGC